MAAGNAVREPAPATDEIAGILLNVSLLCRGLADYIRPCVSHLRLVVMSRGERRRELSEEQLRAFDGIERGLSQRVWLFQPGYYRCLIADCRRLCRVVRVVRAVVEPLLDGFAACHQQPLTNLHFPGESGARAVWNLGTRIESAVRCHRLFRAQARARRIHRQGVADLARFILRDILPWIGDATERDFVALDSAIRWEQMKVSERARSPTTHSETPDPSSAGLEGKRSARSWASEFHVNYGSMRKRLYRARLSGRLADSDWTSVENRRSREPKDYWSRRAAAWVAGELLRKGK